MAVTITVEISESIKMSHGKEPSKGMTPVKVS